MTNLGAEAARFVDGYLVETGLPVRVGIDGAFISEIVHRESAPPRWIAPGFIDLQVNGFGGHDFNRDAPDANSVARAIQELWRHGVTGLCPTVGTHSESHMRRCFEAVVAASARDPVIAHSVLGIHVEGPHISPEDGPRGAHPREHLRPPDVAEYGRWQTSAAGRICIVTLAPELEGAVEYVRSIVSDGVIASIGHTAADGQQIDAAINAGARLATHLGNGAHALIPRHSNYIWPQLADDRLTATFIFDGHHLPPPLIKVVLRAKGIERSVMVSDAVALAGLPSGVYDGWGSGPVELLPGGRLILKGTPYLAGATVSIAECLGVAMRDGGLPLQQAIQLASANPARVLRLDTPTGRGSVRVGASADLTVFTVDPLSARVTIQETVVAGMTVYERAGIGDHMVVEATQSPTH